MLSKAEDYFICDLAEYYNIYNYKEYRVSYIATLAKGLREDSRTRMAISDFEVSLNTMLLASIADSCAFIAWSKTESAQNGGEKPPSILAKICNKEETSNSDILSFNSPEEFEKVRAQLIGE